MFRRALRVAIASTAVVAAIAAASSSVRASHSGRSAVSAAVNEKIVFSRQASSYAHTVSIWTVNPDGRDIRELTHPPKGRLDEYPSWSPDHGRIAFLRFVPNGNFDLHGEPLGRWDLMLMRADGRGIHRLTRNAWGAGNWSGVAWSPDNSRIAFTRYLRNDKWIWTISTNGERARRLARGDCAAWSPDGTEIAIKQDPVSGVASPLSVVDADGGNQRRIGFPGLTYWCPTWSPNGRSIAFLMASGRDVWLYLVNRDGTDIRRLAQGLSLASKDTSRAEWSRNGSNLLIETPNGAVVISVSGGHPRRVASNTYYPQWSPDGQSIAFERGTSGNLFVVNLHGGIPTLIARGAESSLDW